MDLFNKTKIKKNDKVVYYKFPSSFFKVEIITEICLKTQIKEFFIEIYGLVNSDITLLKEFFDNDDIENYTDSTRQRDRIVIHIPISKVKDLLSHINKFDFDEMLIWDKYTTIERFLKNELSGVNLKDHISKFFLDYNKYQNSYVELYLDPMIDSKDIQKLLSE